MADVHSKETRAFNMSRIKGKNTRPEMLVRRYLHKIGFRYNLHKKDLPGKPDIVMPKYKTIIFIHGCFWHGHTNCKFFIIPKTRSEWWLEKISGNIERDNLSSAKLIKEGWKVITIWECELKKDKVDETLAKLPGRILSQTEQ